jgi:hypothetical protein
MALTSWCAWLTAKILAEISIFATKVCILFYDTCCKKNTNLIFDNLVVVFTREAGRIGPDRLRQ